MPRLATAILVGAKNETDRGTSPGENPVCYYDCNLFFYVFSPVLGSNLGFTRAEPEPIVQSRVGPEVRCTYTPNRGHLDIEISSVWCPVGVFSPCALVRKLN